MNRSIEIVLSDPKSRYQKCLCQWSCWLENKIVKCVGHVFRENLGYNQKKLHILRFWQKGDERISSFFWQIY